MKGRSNDSTQISAFLEDARRFVLANRYIADIAPLQLYSSALLFAPQTSIVRNTCGQIPGWIRRCPITPTTWGPELQKLEGHTGWVTAVAFSQDGLLLASASDDQTVRLWNPTTGQEIERLEDLPDVDIISPTYDDMIWSTNRGILNMNEESLSAQAPQLGTDNSTVVTYDWIRRGTRKLLWLPQEYRSNVTSFRDNTFVIGQNSGQVTFIEFDDSWDTV